MASRYDDSAFNYFALSVLVVILIPSTLAYIKKWKAAFSSEYTGLCSCDECKAKAKKLQLKERRPSAWGLLKFFLWILVWLLFLYLLTKARSETSDQPQPVFDPYDILGLEVGASEDDIRKQYRKLSLKWHPDKNPGREDANQKFIAISKAYDTLTDPAIREKWEKYGNPDGPQALSVGIALPSWLVNSKNGVPVLSLYIAFLVLIFPTIAIWYWQSQKDLAHNQLHTRTFRLFVQALSQNMRFKKLLDLLSVANEYVSQIQIRHSDDVVIAKLKPHLPIEEHKLINRSSNKKKIIHPHLIKNIFLWYTHFSRLHRMLPPQMQNDLEILLTHAPKLVIGMVEIDAARGWLVPTVECIELIQMVVQGVWSETSRMGRNTAFQQIPHITEDMVKKLANNKKWKVTSVLQFAKLDIEARKDFYASENFSLQQITDIEHVLKQLPHDVEMNIKTEIEDDDENIGITAGSVVTLFIDFERPSKPEDPKLKDEAIDVHCPFFPQKKREYWWILIGDERTNRIYGLKRVDTLRDKTSIKIPFPVPRKQGIYQWTVFLLSDSYVGFDKKKPLKLNVGKELHIPREVPEEEEDLEEEQDNANDNSDQDLSSGQEDDSENDDIAQDEEEEGNNKSKKKSSQNKKNQKGKKGQNVQARKNKKKQSDQEEGEDGDAVEEDN